MRNTIIIKVVILIVGFSTDQNSINADFQPISLLPIKPECPMSRGTQLSQI